MESEVDKKKKRENELTLTGYRVLRAVLTVSLLSLCKTGLRYSYKIKHQNWERTRKSWITWRVWLYPGITCLYKGSIASFSHETRKLTLVFKPISSTASDTLIQIIYFYYIFFLGEILTMLSDEVQWGPSKSLVYKVIVKPSLLPHYDTAATGTCLVTTGPIYWWKAISTLFLIQLNSSLPNKRHTARTAKSCK